ncbi:MAG TPA: hypothetical protein ENJ09_15030, partial [Planctomycetes bacterium]|nr:hypothetical protein [Planctomycetota bacterium]
SSATAAILRDPAAVQSQLQVLFDEGVDFLSVQFGLSDEVRRKVLELAHAQGLEVWGPRPRELTMVESIEEGQDGYFSMDALLPPGVDWNVVQAPAFRKSIQALAANHRPIVPLFYASVLRLENQAARDDTEGLFALLSPSYTSWWQAELEDRAARLNEKSLAQGKRIVGKQAELLKALWEGGVQLVPGTGTPQPWVFPGRALHQELELWEEAGIPAPAVLEFATRGAAEALGIAEDYGTIAPGRTASLLVLDADPSEHVAALRSQSMLIVRGQVFDSAGIDDLLQTVAARVKKVRDAINRPIDVDAPSVPEGGVVVLDGVVDTVAYGLRLWTEHFSVARLPDGGTAYLGRVVYPDAPYAKRTPREMVVTEIVRDGELASVEVVLHNDGRELRYEGLWTAQSWRMRRSADGHSIGVTSHNEHPVVVDTGSVVTELVLGHARLAENFPIIALHEGLEPEAAHWKMELDDVGNHQVRTHTGRLAFRFLENGAPEKGLSVIGTRALEFDLRSSDTFGGPGAPLPKELRDEIEARRSAAAAIESSAPAAADGGDAEARDGGDDGQG